MLFRSIGGIPEAFEDGKTGILIRPSNVEDIAESVKKFVDNPEFAKETGKAGKEFVEKKFTIENMVSKTLEVYDKVSKSHGQA